MKKKEFSREEYMDKYLHNNKTLEKELRGIPIRAEISMDIVIQEYLPVLEYEYYIDVWDCSPRLAKRIHKKTILQTKIIELKTEKAKELFEKLVEERDIIINRSGHYYIETRKQRALLDKILILEGIRDEQGGRCFRCGAYCSEGEYRDDPYEAELNNNHIKTFICDYCYHQLQVET